MIRAGIERSFAEFIPSYFSGLRMTVLFFVILRTVRTKNLRSFAEFIPSYFSGLKMTPIRLTV